MESLSSSFLNLPEEFLTRLVRDLDDDTVSAIILHGSYARNEATPFSDVDIVRILQETPERKQQKQFIWHEGYLLNLSSRPLSIYHEWLALPQEAVFRISTIWDAHILLDKEKTFHAFQQQARHWKWEPLQSAANAYSSQLVVELSEVILRTLGALESHNTIMLVERILLHILPTVTEAVGVQRGILAKGNNYLRQIQETIGLTSHWTQYYMQAAAVPPPLAGSFPSIEERGIAALQLYRETARMLQASLLPEHLETIETLLARVDTVLDKQIT